MEENKTLPTTAEELQELIEKAVADREDALSKKHSDEMAQLRKQAKDDKERAIEKAKKDANLSAEDRVKKEQEEILANLQKENAELKAKAHAGEVKDALSKSNLPLFLANDSRLVGASTEEELATAIEQVKQDYNSSLPKGATIDTNVVSSSQSSDTKTQEVSELERMRNLGLH